MLRIRRFLVTGRKGQLVSSILARGAGLKDVEIVALGRPALDLSLAETLEPSIRAQNPDAIISAAAYTAVDRAETEESLAIQINAVAPGIIAGIAAKLDIPVIHISTDYVFDGSKTSPYVETDPVGPLGVYGRTKLNGEKSVASETDNYVILRTAWVYSPFGNNFLKTMLRLADTRNEVSVVDDQFGTPTSAFDIADGVIAVARNVLASRSPELRGVFHMSNSGKASWADFATAIFDASERSGGKSAIVRRIETKDYPTVAIRPRNSQLDCTKLSQIHSVTLAPWQSSLKSVMATLNNQYSHFTSEGSA